VRRLLRVLTGAVAASVTGPLWADELPDQVRQAAGDAIRRLDLQTDLPAEPEPAIWHLHLPEWLGTAVLIGGLAVLAWLAIPYLKQLRLPRRPQKEAAWMAAPDDPSGTIAAQNEAVATADELAERGHFVEAMHTLLLQCLADIRRRLDEHFADSLTSREILRRARLTDVGRTALAEIIGRVEATYFGDYPARQADYETCRQKFIELTGSFNADRAA